MQNDILKKAYQHCMEIARRHYENFPVASRLLPASIRPATSVIYAFARRADDIVDEGSADSTSRHADLNKLVMALDHIAANQPTPDPLFIALADVVKQFNLPLKPFYDLLTAFQMDIDQNRYPTYADLDYYCHHSANPVGRLILDLHQQAQTENYRLSDKICTALQLINFAQDIDSDIQQRQRCYIPLDELQCYALGPEDLLSRDNSSSVHEVMLLQLERARRLLVKGAPLVQHLTGRLRWEIRATIATAWCLLDKLTQRTNIYTRPHLRLSDSIRILWIFLHYNRLIIKHKAHRASA